MSRSASRWVASRMIVLTILMPTSAAMAYRPFVSTDAAVADPGYVELEVGCIGFREDHGESTIVAPTHVANVGVYRDFELVAETKATRDLASNGDPWRAEDTALSLKWIAREGIL